MHTAWEQTSLTSLTKTIHALTELRAKGWLCRGQPETYRSLMPSINRDRLNTLAQADKLMRERKSINLFKATARLLMPGEEQALNEDVGALMVLRHYGVPTA
jgi:FRG domain